MAPHLHYHNEEINIVGTYGSFYDLFSSINSRRGVRVLLDNATATINPGVKSGSGGKSSCSKSTLLALLKTRLARMAVTLLIRKLAARWVNQETPALRAGARLCY